MKTSNLKGIVLSALSLAGVSAVAQSAGHDYVLDFKDTGVKIQPTMYGIFFEDINFAADGGLYAEMVKNRSFEFTLPLMGWEQPNTNLHSLNKNSGSASIVNTTEGTNHNTCRIQVKDDKGYSLINEGFRGMGIKEGALYDLSFMASQEAGDITAIVFQFIDKNGKLLGETTIAPQGKQWKKYTAVLKANQTEEKAKLKITFKGTGIINLDMVSLFPQDTWKGRKGGLRKDLAQKLYDLNPGFLRFPGGCIVEGRILERRYQWKKTVGSVEDRESLINRWNTEFSNKLTPDYYQSFGLGFFEYFQLAEDIGAEALPILSCGMACQFNTGELVPLDELDPYVQDALDLIEFANGDTTTSWGKVRESMGHPQPFNLKFIGIGNEQWGPDYFDRYKEFEKAIKGKYPDINIVSGSGPFSDGEYFEYGWEQLRKLNADLVDEHYYKSPDWFLNNAGRYDTYDRNGPKVFAGEYAAHPQGVEDGIKENNWRAAMAEAAFMTGLERNADVVYMTSYAPLFANTDAWQWAPDLIWFNNLESVATPNYYVQKLYGNNPGTNVISITENGKPISGQGGMYASAVTDKNTREVIVKIVNTTEKVQETDIKLKGKKLAKTGTMTTLKNNDLNAGNTFSKENVSPVESSFNLKGSEIEVEVPAYSFVILRVKIL